MHLSLSPHYNTLREKVTVTLEGLFPSTSLILSKLLYKDQADAKCPAKENVPSWSERIRKNETEPKGQCMGPNTKAGFARMHPDTAAPKTGPFSFTFACMSTSALPFRLSLYPKTTNDAGIHSVNLGMKRILPTLSFRILSLPLCTDNKNDDDDDDKDNSNK